MPRKHHPEFDDARVYEYPHHLRQSIDDQVGRLPQAPGVYIFHGDDEALPLYIGKSVNIRARVLSHLRATDEARMLRMTRRITHIRTAGEMGALLLEARLIKQQLPLFNQKLRRNRQLCAWQLDLQGVALNLEVVYASQLNFACEPRLFGLFGSRHAAVEALVALADEHGLCHAILGLEKPARVKPCFRHQIRRCAGACCGQEAVENHHDRLMKALETLQVFCWPHEGAIALKEVCALDPGFVQYHVVRNWCYLGSAVTLDEARKLGSVVAGFDGDGYKILCRPVLSGEVECVALPVMPSAPG